MDILKKFSLLDEVYAQCIASLQGFKLVVSQLNNPAEIQNKIIWLNLQTALVHATITSNYIFSKKPNTNLRTEYLQDTLRPSEESPLYNKNARNYLIHIDEKFDHWINDESYYNGMLESVLPDRKAFDVAYIPKGKVVATFPAAPVTGSILAFEVDAGLRFGIDINGPLILSINK